MTTVFVTSILDARDAGFESVRVVSEVGCSGVVRGDAAVSGAVSYSVEVIVSSVCLVLCRDDGRMSGSGYTNDRPLLGVSGRCKAGPGRGDKYGGMSVGERSIVSVSSESLGSTGRAGPPSSLLSSFRLCGKGQNIVVFVVVGRGKWSSRTESGRSS